MLDPRGDKSLSTAYLHHVVVSIAAKASLAAYLVIRVSAQPIRACLILYAISMFVLNCLLRPVVIIIVSSSNIINILHTHSLKLMHFVRILYIYFISIYSSGFFALGFVSFVPPLGPFQRNACVAARANANVIAISSLHRSIASTLASDAMMPVAARAMTARNSIEAKKKRNIKSERKCDFLCGCESTIFGAGFHINMQLCVHV